jgi:tetratricopeptide (TPR) repeat protein
MIKKRLAYLLFFVFSFVTLVVNGQNSDIVLKHKHLSSQQLLDTANHYFNASDYRTALVCYNLLINTSSKNTSFEHQKKIIEAYFKSAMSYYYMSDFRTSYDFLIRALSLGEKANYKTFEPRIYINIAAIYFHFQKYDLAKQYLLKALNSHPEDIPKLMVLNNLGVTELKKGNLDDAFHYAQEALEFSKQIDNSLSYAVLSTMALIYQNQKRYDSAFLYFQLSLKETKKENRHEEMSEILSNFGNLFLEIQKLDSALHYIGLSDVIAKENKFLRISAENYRLLSKIEEAKGNKESAFEYFKKHTALKDSVFNVGEINQLQHLYEVSKINEEIEQLTIEQRVKERTIYYQKIIQLIMLVVLLLTGSVLLFIYFQKRRVDKSYKVLFEKSINAITAQESLSKVYHEKYKKNKLAEKTQDELLNKILAIMEDRSVICDTDFSIGTLAELTQSNYTYVSQVINNAFKKNFRSFLNSYRIREAERLFSEEDTAKYTIEAVAFQVGFKSRSAFYDAFKEINGISPNFFLKSMQKANQESENK